jgi:hypothetical protein
MSAAINNPACGTAIWSMFSVIKNASPDSGWRFYFTVFLKS